MSIRWIAVVLVLTSGCKGGGASVDKDAGSPSTKPDCVASTECRVSGRCSSKENACVATSDADCRRSENCRTLGDCRLNTNAAECVVGTNADCARTPNCRDLGWCTAASDGVCRLTSTDDCLKTKGCDESGFCTLLEEGTPACVVGTDLDCKRSAACRTEHRCKAKPGPNGTVVTGECI